MISLNCDECGTEFEKKPSQVRAHNYCGNACYLEYKKKTRNRLTLTCAECSKVFERKASEVKTPISFCSTKCSNKKKLVPNVSCSECGEKYHKKPSTIGKNNYCSKRCRIAGSKRNNPKAEPNTECYTCKIAFHVKPSNLGEKNFCSIDCVNEYRSTRVDVQCVQCGKTLSRTASQIHENVYCDKICFGHWRSQNIRGENHPTFYKIDKLCETCGDTFKPLEATSKYCSRACKHKDQEKRVELICECCKCTYERRESELKWAKSRGHSRNFCSTECFGKHSRGSNHPKWIEDRDSIKHKRREHRLTADAKDWREAVYSRDQWICRMCGDRSRAGHPVVLNAHHIKRYVDHPELRHDVDNGITLCEECHRKTYKKEAKYEASFQKLIMENK